MTADLYKVLLWLGLLPLAVLLSASAGTTPLWAEVDQTVPTLQLPTVVATAGQTITLPVRLEAGGQQLAALIFSLDIDQQWLNFDPFDGNADGIPDAITVNVPGAFVVAATASLTDTAGELDFTVFDPFPPFAALPSGALFTIRLTTVAPPSGIDTVLHFASTPPVSASDDTGHTVPLLVTDGTVSILGPPALITIHAAPAVLLANGVSTGTVAAQLVDSLGRPLPGVTVFFTTTVGTISTQSVSDSDGVAKAMLTSSWVLGPASIRASAGEVSAVTVVTYTPGPPATVQITATPASLVADGVSTSTVTALVADSFGHALVGQAVTMTTSLGMIVAAAATDAAGKSTALLTAGSTPGIALIVIQAGAVVAQREVRFKAQQAPPGWTLHLPLIRRS